MSVSASGSTSVAAPTRDDGVREEEADGVADDDEGDEDATGNGDEDEEGDERAASNADEVATSRTRGEMGVASAVLLHRFVVVVASLDMVEGRKGSLSRSSFAFLISVPLPLDHRLDSTQLCTLPTRLPDHGHSFPCEVLPVLATFVSLHALTRDAAFADTITLDPNQYDQEQINLMEERLILLDNDDNAIGEGSKKDCERTHTLSPPREKLKHERANNLAQVI